MLDQPFKGGSFHSHDRRVLDMVCRSEPQARTMAQAAFALGSCIGRDVRRETLRRVACALTGHRWAATADLERIAIDPTSTAAEVRLVESCLARLERGDAPEAVFDEAVTQRVDDDIDALCTTVRHHLASTGAGPRGRELAREIESVYREAARSHEFRHALAQGARLARPAKVPVSPDEVIA